MNDTTAPPIAPGPVTTMTSRVSRMAIVSIVLGILGCFTGVTGIVGVILGIVALVAINRSGGRLSGTGVAIAGICVSAMSLVMFLLVMVAMLLPALASAQGGARVMKATMQARVLGEVARTYDIAATDTGALSTSDWVSTLVDAEFMQSDLVVFPGDTQRSLAMNRALDGVSLQDVTDPVATVLFFECAEGTPLAGGPEDFPDEPRFSGGFIIVTVDGRVQQIAPEVIGELRWEP